MNGLESEAMGCGASRVASSASSDIQPYESEDIYSKYDFGDKLGSGGFGQVRQVRVKCTKEIRAVLITLGVGGGS